MADQQCGACGASWSGDVRWCGRCGAAIDPPAEATSAGAARQRARGRRPWPSVVGVLVVVVGGALVAWALVGTAARDGASPPVDDDVALPADDAVDPTTDADSDQRGGSSMACAPPGCQVWRVDDPVSEGVAVGDHLVLHVGSDEMVARHASDGRELWRRPKPDGLNRNPATMAVSEHGVAFVHGGSPPSTSFGTGSTPDPEPARISIHDPGDGDHRFDLEVDADVGLRLTWVGDRLVAVGTETVPGGLRGRMIVAGADGEVIWRHEGDGPVQLALEGSTLLALGDDRVRRLDITDGTVAWEVRGRLVAPPDDGLLLVQDRVAGQVRVVDFASGNTRATVPAGGARGASSLGPWVLVAHDEELRVHDRSSGELLFRRSVREVTDAAGPVRMASGVQVGDRVVVAWGRQATTEDDEAPPELTVHTLDGQRERTLEIPGLSGAPGPAPVGLHRVDPHGRLVHVTTWGPDGAVVAVDVRSGRVLHRRSGGLLREQDGLLVLRHEQGLTILGPEGELRVRHVMRVAATDPLVVHGVGGMMRVERGLVTGEDAD